MLNKERYLREEIKKYLFKDYSLNETEAKIVMEKSIPIIKDWSKITYTHLSPRTMAGEIMETIYDLEILKSH